ncbi:holo-ACP synthase [Marininema halotolerans]|uniref:Holo-[acyl-carrier-protein] synthase n=1 Tax=Marininema halotolerans TaxID=1155944 RepID=A0A1I6TJQ3_9BACL|nr:holo-ACP synthase [Marininema halotolerans]SFS89449.1 holo-[acyl-carrier protein] synthase [Marininema halotolerans]
MIVGVGVDLVELSHLATLNTDQLSKRILTPKEIEKIPHEVRRRLEWLAGRFAAKEAIAKAIGCGIGSQLSFQDITIAYKEGGQPGVELSTSGKNRLGLQQVHFHLSITHTKKTAAAFVVMESGKKSD